VEKKDELI